MKSHLFLIHCVVFYCLLLSFPLAAHKPSYKINPGDVLDIYVWNEKNLERQAIVRPDGYFSFPLAGEVIAGGLTTGEVEISLIRALDKFLKVSPMVTVSLIKLDGNKISVLGKVHRPGEYLINRPTDIMQALALAGGLNQFAAENKINILRRTESGEQISILFKYGDVKSGDALESNIELQSGDVVVVP